MSEKSSKFARKFVKWGVGILQTTTTMNNENQNIEYKESWRAEYGQQIVSQLVSQSVLASSCEILRPITER